MATRSTAKRKTDRVSSTKEKVGEWKARTISEFKDEQKGTWRAQKLISPEGEKFVGVTRFVTKQNGDEVMTRNRITLKLTEDTISTLDELSVIILELRDLVNS